MEKNQVMQTLAKVKQNSSKRNFTQSVELIVNLKGLILKKQDQQISTYVNLHYNTGKKVSVCAFVGPELKPQADEVCDETITSDDFPKFVDKKLLKKLARKHDFFIAQANIMPKVATTFGKVLGPLGKMPNPKVGAVLPPNGNVKALYEKLQKTRLVKSGNNPVIQCLVGKEDQKDEEVIDNIITAYNSIIHALPNEKHNVKNSYIKLTMGKAFMVGGSEETEEEPKKKDKPIEEQKQEEVKEEKQHEQQSDEKTKEAENKQESPTEEKPKEE